MMSKPLFFLILWIVIAYTICLVPGPNVMDQMIQDKANASNVAVHQDSSKRANSSSLDDAQSSAPGSSEAQLAHPPSNGVNSEIHTELLNGNALNAFLTENVKTKERLGHFLPMIGIAFCLVRLLLTRGWRWHAGLLAALAFVFGLALSIELLQETLPEWFHRGFTLDDIGFSVLGGMLGSLGGFLFLPPPSPPRSLRRKCGF